MPQKMKKPVTQNKFPIQKFFKFEKRGKTSSVPGAIFVKSDNAAFQPLDLFGEVEPQKIWKGACCNC